MDNTLQGHKIGFIGLGVMGKPMAAHLRDAGAELIVYNRSREKMESLAGERVELAESPADVACRVPGGMIVLMLTNTPAFDEVMDGKQGVIEAAKPGTLIIDMSTTAVSATRHAAVRLEEKECHLVDAPVSGGQRGAEAGNLTIMAGGREKDFERARPLFEVMGEKITYMGIAGAGQITKLANQIIVAQTITAVVEALTLAKSAGVDPARVREAIRGGFAESRILAEHGERMMTGNFEPGGRSVLQFKDVREAVRLMEESGLDLPMLKQNVELWEEMVEERGLGELDHSGIWRLYEKK